MAWMNSSLKPLGFQFNGTISIQFLLEMNDFRWKSFWTKDFCCKMGCVPNARNRFLTSQESLGSKFCWVCSSSHLLEQPQEKNGKKWKTKGGSMGYPGQGVKNCLFRSTPSTETTKHRTLWVNSFRIEPTLHTPDISPRNFWSLILKENLAIDIFRAFQKTRFEVS